MYLPRLPELKMPDIFPGLQNVDENDFLNETVKDISHLVYFLIFPPKKM